MKNFAVKLENKAIAKWGFENWKTIATFRMTAIMRKVEM